MMQTMESPHGKRSLRDKTVDTMNPALEINTIKVVSVDVLVYYEHVCRTCLYMNLQKNQQY